MHACNACFFLWRTHAKRLHQNRALWMCNLCCWIYEFGLLSSAVMGQIKREDSGLTVYYLSASLHSARDQEIAHFYLFVISLLIFWKRLPRPYVSIQDSILLNELLRVLHVVYPLHHSWILRQFKSTPKTVITYIRRWIWYMYKTGGAVFLVCAVLGSGFPFWWKVSAVPAPSARGQSSTHIKAPARHRHFCRSSFSPLRQCCCLWPSIRRHFKQVANGAYLCMD